MTKPLIRESTWGEFRAAGLLWWVNRGLHLFGWVLVFESGSESDPQPLRVYPARTSFRGFDSATEGEGFEQLTSHLATTIPELVEEMKS